jgi:hypothetical protein
LYHPSCHSSYHPAQAARWIITNGKRPTPESQAVILLSDDDRGGYYAASFETPHCCYCRGAQAMPTSTRRSASSFVAVPPPPAVLPHGGDRGAIGRGRRRALRRPSGDKVVAPMTSSSSLQPLRLFGVGGGGNAGVDVATATATAVATATAAATATPMTANWDASHATRQRRPPIRSTVPSHLAETLDLAPLLGRVASYAQTRQGTQVIMDLVAPPSPSSLRIIQRWWGETKTGSGWGGANTTW